MAHKSELKVVRWNKHNRTYSAKVNFKGKSHRLGVFQTREEADAACDEFLGQLPIG